MYLHVFLRGVREKGERGREKERERKRERKREHEGKREEAPRLFTRSKQRPGGKWFEDET